MNIKRALEKIKGYCDKHETCRICSLSKYGDEICYLELGYTPADWDIDRLFRKSGGNEEEK